LIPQVEFLGIRCKKVFKQGTALVTVAVGGTELKRRELWHKGEIQVSLRTKRLRSTLQEGAGPVGRVSLRVQEVGVVDPDIGRFGPEFLENLFEELVGTLVETC